MRDKASCNFKWHSSQHIRNKMVVFTAAQSLFKIINVHTLVGEKNSVWCCLLEINFTVI